MLERPHDLRESPGVQPDPFSEILALAKAEATVTGHLDAGGPWSIRFPARDKVQFFAVVRGTCWARLEGEDEPVHFETGDIGLMPLMQPTVLASARDSGVPTIEGTDLFGIGRTRAKVGDGKDFAYIGGQVLLDARHGRLLTDVLPPWIHIRAGSPHAAAFRIVLDQLVAEGAADLPGATIAIAHLTQLLFVQILRAHTNAGGPMPAGWLRAVGDPRIAPALRLLHAEPARDWHLEELAKACAMSRTVFAAHFKESAGVAPLTYLNQWRMRLAERALREGTTAIATIAQSLGYASESAFSNAFKRTTGMSPRAFRTTTAS